MVVKVLWPEEHSDVARSLLRRQADRWVAPDLLRYEVCNTIRKTRALRDAADRAAALASFLGMPITMLPLDRPMMTEALALALERELTAYDASYAVLARHLGTSLVTADDRFVRKMRDPRVVPLSEDPPEDVAA